VKAMTSIHLHVLLGTGRCRNFCCSRG